MTATTSNTPRMTGLGRDVLEKRVAELEAEASVYRLRLEQAEQREKTSLETLTAAQAASTRDLNIARAVRQIGDDPIMQALAPLGAAILRARAKHPVGCALRHLLSEVGEVADAMCIGDVGIGGDVEKREDRIREELLDVAVVAFRMHLGEVRS